MKNFCFNCGNKISEEDMFCPECGTKLEDDVIAKDVDIEVEDIIDFATEVSRGICSVISRYIESCKRSRTTSDDDSCIEDGAEESGFIEDKGSSYKKYGVILTDSKKLANKLNINKKGVYNILNSYCDNLSKLGYKYFIVDAASYKDMNCWYDYQDIILDMYNSKIKKHNPEVAYLYIIGGNDIVPVPVINNYVEGSSDKDIETDLLYSYPYGLKTQSFLESGDIFRAQMLYTVSRLPLASDATVEDLLGFMTKSYNAFSKGGIDIGYAYGQCDPHWQGISSRVSHGLKEVGLFPNYDVDLPEQIYNHNLFISPVLDLSNIERFFNDKAAIYYFNLHGSNAPSNSGYYGEAYKKSGNYSEVFSNNLIAKATRENIFVTEACYGAKYVGYNKEYSMLHSALMNNTQIFMGSSRIAYGCVDDSINSNGYIPLVGADIICSAFIDSLLYGFCAGDALVLARKVFFEKGETPYGVRNGLSPHDALTLAEFNLYGDPMLGFAIDNGSYKRKATQGAASKVVPNVASKDAVIGFKVETLSDRPLTILERVRGAVDANISDIVDRIGKSLYSEFGISPRKPKTVQKIKYKDSREEYNVVYEDKYSAGVKELVVVTDKTGNIKQIYTSK